MGKKMILATTLLVALPATHVNALEEKSTVNETVETPVHETQQNTMSDTTPDYSEQTVPSESENILDEEETITESQDDAILEEPSVPSAPIFLTGFQTVNGETYYFDEFGNKLTGLQTIGENTYYFEANGKMFDDGFKVLNGKTYFFSRVDGRMRTGMFAVDTPLNCYYFDETTGVMQTGLHKIGDNYYYFEANGKMFHDGFKVLNGKTYFFSRVDGRMRTGMFAVDTPLNCYYFDETTGEMQTGLHKIGENTYYFESNGRMFSNGVKELGGKKYFFSRVDGRMRYGLFEVDTELNYYYFDEVTGEMITGLQKIGDNYFYFEENGPMFHDGFKVLNGKTYFFSRVDGRLRTGMFAVDTPLNCYYFDETTGEMQTGLHKIGENTYYFESNGRMFSNGVKEIDGKRYFFSRVDGRMRYGLFEVDTEYNYYYFDETTGEMITGLQKIGENTYYFTENGPLYRGGFKVIDGKTYFFSRVDGRLRTGMFDIDGVYYYFDESGVMQTGYHKIDGITYYFNEDGSLYNGFYTVNGNQYYMQPDGTRAVGWHVIQGVKYYFNANGTLIASNAKFIIDVSSWQGVIDWDAVKAEGKVDGVILRMAINDVLVDNQFERNLRELQRLGIPFGVYLYSYAENGTEAKMEADWMVTLLRRYNIHPALGIYYDIEEWTHLTPNDFDAIIPTFVNTVKQAGYSNVGVYASKNYINTYFSDAVKPYVTWVAQYYYQCNYQGSYQMWQYGGGNEGEYVAGINGRVDSNVWSDSFETIV